MDNDRRTKTIAEMLHRTRHHILALRERDKVFAKHLEGKLTSIESKRARRGCASEKDISNVKHKFREIIFREEYTSENLKDREARENKEQLEILLKQQQEDTDKALAVYRDKRNALRRTKVIKKIGIPACGYGEHVVGSHCMYFPCFKQSSYRSSMGFTNFLTQSVTADATILEHANDDLQSVESDPYAQTLTEACSNGASLATKSLGLHLPLARTKAKELSLNAVMSEMKRHNLAKKPQEWAINYGKPMPLKLILKPPRV